MTQKDIWNLFLIFISLNWVVKFALNRLNAQYISQHRDSVPQKFKDAISLAEHQKSADYTITNLNFGMIQTGIGTFATIMILGFDIPYLFDSWAMGMSTDIIYRAFAFFGFFMLLQMIIGLPFELYKIFVIEEKFGFNKMTVGLFIKDKIKELLLSIILGGVILYLLLKVITLFKTSWWILGWALIMAFQFILMWAYPKFIAPLFNKFTKMEDGDPLKEKIEELTQSTGIKFKDYYTMNASLRSSHGNAYFTGFGNNRRIVLFDTLAQTLSPLQAKAVLAHEMGHLKYKHIIKSLVISTVLLFIGFYVMYLCSMQELFFSSFTKAEQNPHMLLFLFQTLVPIVTFFATPLFSMFSRKNEFEADDFASEHADARDLIDALISLYKENSSFLLSHPLFSKFYYSHPPAVERVKFLESRIKSAH
jgi:STE24 endopeptidase